METQIHPPTIAIEKLLSTISIVEATPDQLPVYGCYYPCGLAISEQVRSLVRDESDLGTAVPVDVFVLASGEPELRAVTKIGGVPYRPAGLRWPLNADGTPMTFLCQFRFTESRDFLGTVPNDVLLIFTRDSDLYWPDNPDQFYFEWHSLGITDLIAAREVPRPAWDFVTCHGYRYRTVDYVEAKAVDAVLAWMEQHYPEGRLGRPWYASHAYMYCRLRGVKIGGANACPPEYTSEQPGRLICSLSDVNPPIEEPWPWINRRESQSWEEGRQPKNHLIWRDGVQINFYLDGDKIDWSLCFM